jgi:hypothetical protein
MNKLDILAEKREIGPAGIFTFFGMNITIFVNSNEDFLTQEQNQLINIYFFAFQSVP